MELKPLKLGKPPVCFCQLNSRTTCQLGPRLQLLWLPKLQAPARERLALAPVNRLARRTYIHPPKLAGVMPCLSGGPFSNNDEDNSHLNRGGEDVGASQNGSPACTPRILRSPHTNRSPNFWKPCVQSPNEISIDPSMTLAHSFC